MGLASSVGSFLNTIWNIIQSYFSTVWLILAMLVIFILLIADIFYRVQMGGLKHSIGSIGQYFGVSKSTRLFAEELAEGSAKKVILPLELLDKLELFSCGILAIILPIATIVCYKNKIYGDSQISKMFVLATGLLLVVFPVFLDVSYRFSNDETDTLFEKMKYYSVYALSLSSILFVYYPSVSYIIDSWKHTIKEATD